MFAVTVWYVGNKLDDGARARPITSINAENNKAIAKARSRVAKDKIAARNRAIGVRGGKEGSAGACLASRGRLSTIGSVTQ